jgi:hypothetical protein
MGDVTSEEAKAILRTVSGFSPDVFSEACLLTRVQGRLFQAEIEYARALTMSPAECLRLAREDILDCTRLLEAFGEPVTYLLPGTKAALARSPEIRSTNNSTP